MVPGIIQGWSLESPWVWYTGPYVTHETNHFHFLCYLFGYEIWWYWCSNVVEFGDDMWCSNLVWDFWWHVMMLLLFKFEFGDDRWWCRWLHWWYVLYVQRYIEAQPTNVASLNDFFLKLEDDVFPYVESMNTSIVVYTWLVFRIFSMYQVTNMPFFCQDKSIKLTIGYLPWIHSDAQVDSFQ